MQISSFFLEKSEVEAKRNVKQYKLMINDCGCEWMFFCAKMRLSGIKEKFL